MSFYHEQNPERAIEHGVKLVLNESVLRSVKNENLTTTQIWQDFVLAVEFLKSDHERT